jgi:hypothetical protein
MQYQFDKSIISIIEWGDAISISFILTALILGISEGYPFTYF